MVPVQNFSAFPYPYLAECYANSIARSVKLARTKSASTRYILCIGIGRGRIGRDRSTHQSASQPEQSERARPIGQTLNQTPSHRDHPACPDQRTRKKKTSDQGARLLFPETEFEPAMQCMSWCVASISALHPRCSASASVAPPFFTVHWCTDAGKTRNRLTLSHFVSREKRLPSRQTRSASRSLVMISNPDPAFSASQKASWGACLGKCPDNCFPCSLSPEVLHVRTTNPLEKDRFTRSCGCCRELRSLPQGKLGKILPYAEICGRLSYLGCLWR